MRYLLTDAIIVTGEKSAKGAIAIDGRKIAGVWYDTEESCASEQAGTAFPDAEVIDLGGKMVIPGVIDVHVHFREPGMTHKGDIGSESKAALLGGVTSYIDMPNTNPPTVGISQLEEKLSLAEGRSWANYGFHIGATNSNLEELQAMSVEDRKAAAIKVFMGSSTGNMLVDDVPVLEKIFGMTEWPVLIHSEDEQIIRDNLAEARAEFGDDIPFSIHPRIRSSVACMKSTQRALEMAMKLGTRLHILHVTTKMEVKMIEVAKRYNPQITAETSANYLTFSDRDYDRYGAMIKCNPAVKSETDRDALREALRDGIIDTIGSDHAPHLLEEKQRPYTTCPSGLPSIRQSLQAVLKVASEAEIPLERVVSAMSERPAEIIGIKDRGFIKKGFYADLVVLDPEADVTVEDPGYKCGWSPYTGQTLKGKIDMVFLNGKPVVKDGNLLEDSPSGARLEYR